MTNLTMEEFIVLPQTEQLNVLHIFGDMITDIWFDKHNYLITLCTLISIST